jgi:hypothetical protein
VPKLLIIVLLLIAVAGVLYFFVFTAVIKIDSSSPYGAAVELDGIVLGATPVRQRVRAGTHQVRVFKEGFETWEGEVKVSGSTKSISVGLNFLLRSKPTGAAVIMDGEHLGDTDLAVDLKPGLHTFEFSKDGYRTERFNATIPQDASDPLPVVTLTVAEEEEAPPTPEEWLSKEVPEEHGTIQVISTPDAQVYLDGFWKGETPLTIVDVRVGSYVITLSREGYRDLRKTVYVKKNETTRFAGELKPESVDQ